MAFESIGFHAALILNRLRNKREIEEHQRPDEQDGYGSDDRAEHARGELANPKRKTAHF